MKFNKYTLIGIGCTIGSAAFGLISSMSSEKRREEEDKAYLEKLYNEDKQERENEEEES